MNRNLADTYVCPIEKTALTLHPDAKDDKGKPISKEACAEEITHGKLVSQGNRSYELRDGVPCFIASDHLSQLEIETKHQYEEYYTEEFYDNVMDWLFQSFCENEEQVRESMVDTLSPEPSSRVLEIGCGTGCDSARIAMRLGSDGELFLQDLSAAMVGITKNKLTRDAGKLGLSCKLNFFVSPARHLPFPDAYFDSVFHFGGFNNFEDPKGTLLEFSRITKEGGIVVFGDESVPPWLEGTTFGDIVCTNNPLFKHKAPLADLPACARDVNVRWLLGNCFYLISFKVGSGAPPLNLDLPHKGRRGGTMRTRYYGQLEGVTVEAKELAMKAALEKGVSMHTWLDDLVRNAAVKDLAKL